jgi:hypothetical protein
VYAKEEASASLGSREEGEGSGTAAGRVLQAHVPSEAGVGSQDRRTSEVSTTGG